MTTPLHFLLEPTLNVGVDLVHKIFREPPSR